MTASHQQHPVASHAILRWQLSQRIGAAIVITVAELALRAADGHATRAWPIALVLAIASAYVIVSAWIAASGFHHLRPGALQLLPASADATLLVALAAVAPDSMRFERLLLLGVFAVHLNSVRSSRPAWAVAALVAAGGAMLQRASSPLTVTHLWWLGAFMGACAWIIADAATTNARLRDVLRLLGRAEDGDFSQAYDEGRAARPDLADDVGQAFNRVRQQLSSMVLTDPLTGCLNRRGFDAALAREVARTTRSGDDLALLAIDVDHFKGVNDTLGHPAGDLVLRQLGGILRRAAREGDIVARTGGEEFCIVLPDTPVQGAAHLADRLCDEIRCHAFGDAGMTVRITASIGVASAHQWDRRSAAHVAEALKGRADEALYVAKRTGRDRARSWAARESGQLDLGVTA